MPTAHALCRAGGALKPDVVAYNTVMRVQATSGHLPGMLETLSGLNASGLRATAATYCVLMHAHMERGAAQTVVELWYQLLHARVLPGTQCMRSFSLAALRLGDTGARRAHAAHAWPACMEARCAHARVCAGMMQVATARYFAHLAALPASEASTEACVFLQTHGELGPGPGLLWPPGLSPSELCATIMRRGQQPSSHLAYPPLSSLRAAHQLPAHYM